MNDSQHLSVVVAIGKVASAPFAYLGVVTLTEVREVTQIVLGVATLVVTVWVGASTIRKNNAEFKRLQKDDKFKP
jgi:hypothetical protein